MLRKLLKYDLMATGRVMLPLLAVLLVASLAMGLNVRFTQEANLISVLIVVIYILVVVSFSLITIVFMITRFYKNLLGQEGYLMFSLPVTTMQNVLSKSLTTIIWVVASGVVGLIAGLVMVGATGAMGTFQDQIEVFVNLFKMSGAELRTFIVYALAILLGVFKSISEINAAIAAGHEWPEHRLIGSFIAYIIFSICETTLAFLFKGRILETGMAAGADMLSEYGITLSTSVQIMIPAILGIIIYNLITWWLLDRKLNLQ